MMSNYEVYEVEDFILDYFFIDWVLKGTKEHCVFWDQWILTHPDRKHIIDKARIILTSITIKPLSTGLSDSQVDDIIESVRKRM